jgi:hypothetical protein
MSERNVEYTLLNESKSQLVTNLLALYDKNPYAARVVYMNSGDKGFYANYRLGLFKEGKSFNIVLFRKMYGVSKTNRIYNRETRIVNICYKDNKFHIIINNRSGKVIRPLTLNNLQGHFNQFVGDVIKYLKNNFSWIGYLQEKSILNNVAFNTIIKNKIYSYKKAIKHVYNIPYPIGNKIHQACDSHSTYENQMFGTYFKDNLKYLENITSFNVNWLTGKNLGMFNDSLRMAKILDKKINCKWCEKRLKLEHDQWSKEMTNILFVEDDRKMTVSKVYKLFAEYSSFEILTTTKEMYYEGTRNSHCVAVYVSKVNSGACGIYRIGDYTLELIRTYGDNSLKISQFRGYKNVDAPKDLFNMVIEKLNKFNADTKTQDLIDEDIYSTQELPF